MIQLPLLAVVLLLGHPPRRNYFQAQSKLLFVEIVQTWLHLVATEKSQSLESLILIEHFNHYFVSIC